MPAQNLDRVLSPRLKNIIETVYQNSIETWKYERGALDENWVDECDVYYNRFSSPEAIRVFYREPKSESVFGLVNLTPRRELYEFSEMYFKPPLRFQKQKRYVTCKLQHSIYGLRIDCVPFIMPDNVVSVCMHGAIWIVLQHLNKLSKGHVKKLTLPEIQKLACGHSFCDGEGLNFNQAKRIIKMCDCEAVSIDNRRPAYPFKERYTEQDMERILYAHVESALPVILGVDANKLKWWGRVNRREMPGYHAIVCIGHTMKGGKIDGYIFHDESAFPYQILKTKELFKAWKVPTPKLKESGEYFFDRRHPVMQAVVGVPPRVKIKYEIAELAAFLAIEGLIKNKELKKRPGLRPVLMSGTEIDAFLKQNNLQKIKSKMDIPSWSWAFFISSTKIERVSEKYSGLILVDATSFPLPDKNAPISDIYKMPFGVILRIVGDNVYLKDTKGRFRNFVIKNGKLIEQKIPKKRKVTS
jgi:hypothetical protein